MLIAALLVNVSAYGGYVVEIDDWMYDGTANQVLVAGSTAAGASLSVSPGPVPDRTTTSYTWDVDVTGLTLNTSGNGDDAISFTFEFAGTSVIDVLAGQSPPTLGIGTDAVISGSDVLTLSGHSAVVSYDGGATTGTATFLGVSRLLLDAINPTNDIKINGVNYDVLTAPYYREVAIDPPLPSAGMSATTDDFTLINWDAQIFIPEPSSAILLGALGLLSCRGRKRRTRL